MLKAKERRLFDALFARLWSVDAAAVIAPNQRHAHSIRDLKIDGVIRLNGRLYLVVSQAAYQETNDKGTKDRDYVVTELVLLKLDDGETHFIEWAIDDELEISFTERKLKVPEVRNRLCHQNGRPLDIDEEIDEVVDAGDGLQFNGRDYGYDDDWAFRFESSDGRSLRGYMYEFGSEEEGWLSIEGWKEGKGWDYEVFLSRDIDPGQIEIIVTGS